MSRQQPEKYKKQLLIALEKHLGIVTTAAKEVGISRERFYAYYNSDEEFRASVDNINNYTLDFVETQLLKKIKEGSERSILFYMRYKGRGRGYKESIDIDANIRVEQPLLKPLDEGEDDTNISDR